MTVTLDQFELAEAAQRAYWKKRVEAGEILTRLGQMETRLRDRCLPARRATHNLRVLSFTPWSQQRKILRALATGSDTVILVAGRQVGKTEVAIDLTIRTALDRPGSYSILLAPTFPIARTAIDKMRLRTKGMPGVEWKEQQKRMVFPNGSIWQVWSADRNDDAGRGANLTGVLWIDEAALVAKKSLDAMRGGQASVGGISSEYAESGSVGWKPIRIYTTTPRGKNWIYDEWSVKKEGQVSLRFPTMESPFANLDEIRSVYASEITHDQFAQEYLSEFVDSLLLAFPDTSNLFRAQNPDRSGERDVRWTLGLDLGKDQDWTVCTKMNKFGEAEIIGRWQHVDWVETEQMIADLVQSHGIGLVCMDKALMGGPIESLLLRRNINVLGIYTNLTGAKQKMVELTRADVSAQRIWVQRGSHTDQLQHELKRFQGTRYVTLGNELIRYEGVQLRGEHDDCVVSLCLANWGREHGWLHGDPLSGDFSGFKPTTLKGRPRKKGKFGGFGPIY